MKKFCLALFAMAVVLAITPAALADSFTFDATQGPITVQATLAYDSSAPISPRRILGQRRYHLRL